MSLDIILAQGATSVWVGGGIVAAASVLMIRHLSNRTIHMNDTKLIRKELCNERYGNIKDDITEIKDSMRRMEAKLDKLAGVADNA